MKKGGYAAHFLRAAPHCHLFAARKGRMRLTPHRPLSILRGLNRGKGFRMSTTGIAGAQTKTEGAVKAGNGRFIFPLTQMAGIEAGTGYSTAEGPVVEGERIRT